MREKGPASARELVQWAGLLGGPILALLGYVLLPESYLGDGGKIEVFSSAGRASLAVGIWMATWWLTEAVHVSATALLPLALFPLLGAAKISAAAAPYGHHLIFLFMGGFILSLGMQRWGLHRRIALITLRVVGTKPHNMVGGFMLSSAIMSMWVSNTATAVMMLPIAMSVLDLVEKGPSEPTPETRDENFGLCMMLGIAYACSIGGIGTIIGTPPNLFLVSFIRETMKQEISFVKWLAIGMPVVAVFLPATWLLLTRVLYPIRLKEIAGGRELTEEAYRELGPMNRGERTVLVVFCLTALAWILSPILVKLELFGMKPLAGLSDSGIAMLASVALFTLPVDSKERVFVMDWETAKQLPWGILILFGGGLSLAAALDSNGVGQFLGSSVGGLRGVPGPVLVLIVVGMVIFLTELTSNTATTAALVPILAGIAPALGLHPFALIIPAGIAASCAFMMPVATPPNAIVFASGKVTIPQMSRAGLWLNLLGVVVLSALAYLVILPVLGV